MSKIAWALLLTLLTGSTPFAESGASDDETAVRRVIEEYVTGWRADHRNRARGEARKDWKGNH